MDEFLNDIIECLEAHSITKDIYEEADEKLMKEFKTVLAGGDMNKLLRYIHQHNKYIKPWCLGDKVLINVYSHDPKKEFPIDGQTIQLDKYEQKIMEAYDLMIDILY